MNKCKIAIQKEPLFYDIIFISIKGGFYYGKEYQNKT